jgi:hypothetical protein
MTTLIVCSDPLACRAVDPAFADEVKATRRASFAPALLFYERLRDTPAWTLRERGTAAGAL